MSEAQLEALYAGLVGIAALPSNELQALVQSLLVDKKTPPKVECRQGIRSRGGFASDAVAYLPLSCHAARDHFVDARLRCDLLLVQQAVDARGGGTPASHEPLLARITGGAPVWSG
jgi:hypothetical protein